MGMMTKSLAKSFTRIFLCLLVPVLALACKSDLRTGWNGQSDAGGAGGAEVGVTATTGGSTGSTGAACSGSGWAQAGIVRDGLSTNTAIGQIATAISDSGTAVVTWYEFSLPLQTGDTGQLFASVCHVGSWTTPALLASTKTVRSVLAARADGVAMVAWAQSSSDGSNAIWEATLDPASASWSSPTRVGAPAGLSKPSAIAMGSDGTAMIVWNETQTDWASRFNGSAWEAPVAISVGPDPLGEAGIVVSPGAQAYLALWQETRQDLTPVTSSIWARRYSNGTWEAPTMLDKGDVSMAIGPPGAPRSALAMDASGNAAAGWFAGYHQLRGAMYSAASNRWTSAQTLADNGQELILVLDSQGRAVASWDGNVSTDAGTVVRGNLGWGDPQGGTWQTTLTLQESGIYVGSDSKGHTWAAWGSGSFLTNDAELWAANYDPATGLTSKKAIWTPAALESPMSLSLSVSPSGRVFSAMTAVSDSPSFHYKLVAATYDPN
jgi:hypothetical protein